MLFSSTFLLRFCWGSNHFKVKTKKKQKNKKKRRRKEKNRSTATKHMFLVFLFVHFSEECKAELRRIYGGWLESNLVLGLKKKRIF